MRVNVQEAVGHGAALLDRERPDWWKHVNTGYGEFDITSAYRCVLGQLYGSYYVATSVHLNNTRLAIKTGFCPTTLCALTYRGRESYRLAWKAEIDDRRLLDDTRRALADERKTTKLFDQDADL